MSPGSGAEAPKAAIAAHALVSFYEGARAHALGALLKNNDMIDVGLRKVRKALVVIDASDEGRDILIPFLTHQDAMVRMEAAQALHATRRGLATPVLLDLALTCVTEAVWPAGNFLIFAGGPCGESGLEAHHPLKFDDALYKEALLRFDRLKI